MHFLLFYRWDIFPTWAQREAVQLHPLTTPTTEDNIGLVFGNLFG
jgi:hypothetical protein